jgi:hypothetical protein
LGLYLKNRKIGGDFGNYTIDVMKFNMMTMKNETYSKVEFMKLKKIWRGS